ncbi:MAG: hypothetical protein K2K05_07545 [Muribaculaceae bacterium]|nr:hypothetical protein [Muribaculaceae bacterium]
MRIEKAVTIVLKILAFLFCFLIVKSIFGLFYWRMTHLSPDDLAWVKTIAQKTSHDRFVSQTSPPMKLTIKGIFINNDGNPFYFSTAGGDIYEAYAGYDYVLTGNNQEINGWLMITREIDSDSLVFGVGFKDYRTANSSGQYVSLPLKTRSIEVRGKVFDDCICSDSIHWGSNPYHNKSDTLKVDKLIVSKKYGLIYFRYSDGTEYYRDFQ